MAERLAQGTEGAGLATIIVIWISASLDWLNDNHFAVISIVAIMTGIVTVVAAIYRYKLGKREVDIYEESIRNKKRRTTDKGP